MKDKSRRVGLRFDPTSRKIARERRAKGLSTWAKKTNRKNPGK